jgi:hypothetical protein
VLPGSWRGSTLREEHTRGGVLRATICLAAISLLYRLQLGRLYAAGLVQVDPDALDLTLIHRFEYGHSMETSFTQFQSTANIAEPIAPPVLFRIRNLLRKWIGKKVSVLSLSGGRRYTPLSIHLLG